MQVGVKQGRVVAVAGDPEADVNKAVAAAKKAFPAWSQTSKEERLALLRRLLDIYQRRFEEMAQAIEGHIAERMPQWAEDYPGVEDMSVAVMGCVVNGPGESKHADIGISLPGTFEEPKAPVFIDGELDRTLKGDGLVEEFIGILEGYVERRYGSPTA